MTESWEDNAERIWERKWNLHCSVRKQNPKHWRKRRRGSSLAQRAHNGDRGCSRNRQGLAEGYSRRLVTPWRGMSPGTGELAVWSSKINAFLKQVSTMHEGTASNRVPQSKDKEWNVFLPLHTGTRVFSEQNHTHVLGLSCILTSLNQFCFRSIQRASGSPPLLPIIPSFSLLSSL